MNKQTIFVIMEHIKSIFPSFRKAFKPFQKHFSLLQTQFEQYIKIGKLSCIGISKLKNNYSKFTKKIKKFIKQITIS